MYRGYTKGIKANFPKGTKVRIRKGTPVHATAPGKEGTRPAGRTYTVTVDHVLDGFSQRIGVLYRDGSWHWMIREKDLYGVMERRGLPYGTAADTEASMEVLKEEALRNWRESLQPEAGTEHNIYLHVTNPTVRWGGSGGYWSDCDVNLVEIVEEDKP